MIDVTVTASPDEPREVWLRGNSRVAASLGTVALVVDGVVVAAAFMAIRSGSTAVAWWLVAAVAGIASSCLFLLAWASSRPRLVRQGGRLLVRVSPLVQETVPLDVVECVFSGSSPIAEDGAPAAFRVGTVILRLAERALDHRSRDTFAPWVTWSDGSIVIDGRWCEPLSPARARELGVRLGDAKRANVERSTAGVGDS